MKKVLLIVIDALSSRVVTPALDEGRLPNMQRLRAAADLDAESVAVFPSITPAATSSLVTGCYPRDHGISGAYWYLPDEKQVVYYGYDIWAIWEEGMGDFIKDFLVNLNECHLQAKTLFQRVEKAGRQAASLNYLIYHGNQPHQIEMPIPFNLLPGAPTDTTVGGPTLLYFGDMIRSPLASGEVLSAAGGVFNRYGFTDDTTADLLCQLVEKASLPDFTLAYFPENDFHSHEVGPVAALDHLEELDEELGAIFAAFGGLEQMLAEICVVVTGDHAQSDVVADSERAGIQLNQLLEDFAVAAAGTPMATEDDLVICPNLRTAQIYFHTPTVERFEQIVTKLLDDDRIDQVIWSDSLLATKRSGFQITTAACGRLHVWPAGAASYAKSAQQATDLYGNQWQWEGDLCAVDGHVEGNTITFGDYPNAFERIAGILELHTAGHLWVTSHPGYEFALEHTEIHTGGGSHGSLHRLDSLSPLWVAGSPDPASLPQSPRAVDVASICLATLGIGK